MLSTSVISHLLSGLRRAIGRVLLALFLGFVITAAIIEIVAFFATSSLSHLSAYHPNVLTHIAAIVFGLIVGYAVSVTVLVEEVIRYTVTTVQGIEKEINTELGSGAKIVSDVVQNIERRI